MRKKRKNILDLLHACLSANIATPAYFYTLIFLKILLNLFVGDSFVFIYFISTNTGGFKQKERIPVAKAFSLLKSGCN